jgi:hypothetical protein
MQELLQAKAAIIGTILSRGANGYIGLVHNAAAYDIITPWNTV